MAKKDSTDVFMTELDAYLFGEGTHYEIYNKMGAHKAVKDRTGRGLFCGVGASCKGYFCSRWF